MTAEPISYSLKDAAAATGVDPSTLRKAYQDGALDARKVGTKILISRDALREWLAALPKAR